MQNRSWKVTFLMFVLAFWIGGVFVALALHAWMCLSNYMGFTSAFDLIGFEQRPLSTDPLLGPYLGFVMGDATLSNLYAAVLAATIAFGLIAIMHYFLLSIELLSDRHAFKETGDRTMVHAVNKQLVRNGVIMLLLGIPLFFALRWDIALYRLRASAGATGIKDPSGIMGLPAWGTPPVGHELPDAIVVIGIGAWGYIAVTILACLVLEISLRKTKEANASLQEALNEVDDPRVPPDPGLDETYGEEIDTSEGYYDNPDEMPSFEIDDDPSASSGERQTEGDLQ